MVCVQLGSEASRQREVGVEREIEGERSKRVGRRLRWMAINNSMEGK